MTMYFTTTNACSCPDYEFRKSRAGSHCKHQEALLDALALVYQTVRQWRTVDMDVDLSKWVQDAGRWHSQSKPAMKASLP